MNTKNQNKLQRYVGRHVVVTGAGTGIGQAIALRLAQEGANLSLFARDASRLEETAKKAKTDSDAQVVTASCDIRDREQVNQRFKEAFSALGPIFAVIANSGVGGPNAPGPDDRFDDLIATNLTGTYSCLRAAERHLLPGPNARHLVIISSILARLGVPGYTGYCASKAALNGLGRSLAVELASQNIQVNSICPGWVDTSMAWEGIDGIANAMGTTRDEAFKGAMSAVPLGRMGKPADIAGMVAWLLSDDAKGVTGQALDMNGGAFMT